MNPTESTYVDPLMAGEAAFAALPLTPQARVDASRAAIQQWILRTYHPEQLPPEHPDATGSAASHPEPGEPAWLGVVVDALSDVPVANMAVRYLRRWWSTHPLRATAQFATEAGRDLLGPTATKHPWLVLGGAAVAGAALVRLKPWNWISGSTLVATLLPPISLASLLTSVTGMFNGVGEMPDMPTDDPSPSPSPSAPADWEPPPTTASTADFGQVAQPH